jgi:hypothetical protein
MNHFTAPSTDTHTGVVYALTIDALISILAEMRRDGMMYRYTPVVPGRLDQGYRISFAALTERKQHVVYA